MSWDRGPFPSCFAAVGSVGRTTMAWKFWLAGAALGVALQAGCRQQSFLSEADYRDMVVLPPASCLESNPSSEIVARPGIVPPPTTVDDTERQIRYLSLREAIAI